MQDERTASFVTPDWLTLMAALLATAGVIVATAVSVRFQRFCRNSCLTGYDNIALVRAAT